MATGDQIPPRPLSRRSSALVLLQTAVYVILYVVTAFVFGPLLGWLGSFLVGVTTTGLLAAAAANALSMRIYEQRSFLDIGLHWNLDSARNLGWGLAGGMGAACLVLGGSLASGAARFKPAPEGEPASGSFAFVTILLLAGSLGEEMLFRGFGFQTMLRAWGPVVIFPVGILFALLHLANPHANALGIINTAGFGILFGYAFLRSRDLWLPTGLHFGWNFTLPLFGVNVSGLTMKLTGYTMEWTAGNLWSGGAYGPEASVLTSGIMVLLFLFLAKASIRPQRS